MTFRVSHKVQQKLPHKLTFEPKSRFESLLGVRKSLDRSLLSHFAVNPGSHFVVTLSCFSCFGVGGVLGEIHVRNE